jgi:long-chain acyl-CoA synthetase
MFDTIPKLLRDFAFNRSSKNVLFEKDENGVFHPITWNKLYELCSSFGAGLLSLGVKKGDHIGIISDNRSEWLIADFGILGIGCADVPRGSDSMADEIAYILNHGDCSVALAEDETQLQKILSVRKSIPRLRNIIVIDPHYEKTAAKRGRIRLFTFREILTLGKEQLKKDPDCFNRCINEGEPADLATIIYTSGTTGEPKGVMLSHSNYMHQIRAPLTPLNIGEGDLFISVLPIWHSFERAVDYAAIFASATLAYSKPISQVLLNDMEKISPTIFPSVPRIWEKVKQGIYKKVDEEGGIKKSLFLFFIAVGTLHSKLYTMFRGLKPQFKRRYRVLDMLLSVVPLVLLTPLNLLGQVLVFRKIKNRLGGKFRFGVSGAGALPPHVDDFFSAAGILLLEGYGLTEAAPIVSVRSSRHAVPGTIGAPLPEVRVKVVDDSGTELPPGHKGVLFVKGPNVMLGYYKKPEETEKTIAENGWLDTGDLAMLTHKGEIKILGRVKDTIVLLGGENIEPEPIEETVKELPLVDQVMVVGQDQRYLGALVIPAKGELEEHAKQKGISFENFEDLVASEAARALIMSEINQLVSPKRGFKLFERIHKIHLLAKAFEVGIELTHTLKLRRIVITETYRPEIDRLFGSR